MEFEPAGRHSRGHGVCCLAHTKSAWLFMQCRNARDSCFVCSAIKLCPSPAGRIPAGSRRVRRRCGRGGARRRRFVWMQSPVRLLLSGAFLIRIVTCFFFAFRIRTQVFSSVKSLFSRVATMWQLLPLSHRFVRLLVTCFLCGYVLKFLL